MFPFIGLAKKSQQNRVSGSGQVSLPVLLSAGHGQVGRTGASAILAALVSAGSGKVGRKITEAMSLKKIVPEGLGKVGRKATGSAALSRLAVSGTGVSVNPYFDSYYSSIDFVPKFPAEVAAIGQAFSLGSAKTLKEIGFYLAGESGVSGYYYFELFACSGTPGSNGVPTGSALVSVSGNSGVNLYPTFVLVPLAVSNYYMAAGNYVVTARWTGSNNLYAGVDSTSPTHAGNYCYKSGSTWYADSGKDMSFRIKGT